MKWFLVSPFSINVLSVSILLFFLLYFLSRNERKSPATKNLLIFLSGANLVFVSFFFIFSSLSPGFTVFAWRLLHLFVFAAVPMVQFAYYFLENPYPRESRIALIVCLVAACLVYPYYIYRTSCLEPVYLFEAYFFVFLNTPEIGIVIGLELLWVMVVFFRKAVLFSKSEGAGGDRRTRVIRNLMLIFLSPIVLVFFIILAYQGSFSWGVVAHILGTGFMVAAFVFTVLYINNCAEPSTFMIKLIGVSLGTILIVFGLAANIAVAVRESAYDRERLMKIEQCKKTVAGDDQSDLPEGVAYVVGGSAAEGDGMPSIMKRRYRKLSPLNPNDYFVYYNFIHEEKLYEAGFSYIEYRQLIHKTCVPLLGVVVGTVAFVVLVFPAFFRTSLLKPMNALLDGVREVNNGNLKVKVPVQVEDEIGYLSNSFNNMVNSILRAQQDLEDSLDHQVKLTDAYSRFVPKEFLRFLEKENIIDISLGDNIQTEMSILFADIRSFTMLSEKMTPEENFDFINSYLGRVGPIVRDNHGFIDKYTGDGIMALFPKRADNAVKAAVGMQEAIKVFNEQRTESGYDPIRFGIGIHTGAMMLGTIGEEKRMEGTVISDAVNLASRMEGLTKLYGASIIVSGETLSSLEDASAFENRYLDDVQVKGKKKQVGVHEILDGIDDDRKRMKMQTRETFEQGVSLYRKKEFEEAIACFEKVVGEDTADKAASLYIQRCENFMKFGVPDGWDGVTTIDEKL